MPAFRVETAVDQITGKIYAQLFYPEDAATPIATTAPIYNSHANAETDILNMFKNVFTSKKP